MDYESPSRRKSKNDKRAKMKYNVYKKGGNKRTRKKKEYNESK